MKELLALIRGSVRPAVTLVVVGASAVFIARGIDVPEWWVLAFGNIVTAWFLSRKNGKG